MTPTPSDAQPPEWIRVDREDGDHGFWTCAAATETSPKYIRADLFDAERQKREAAEERARILGDKYNQWFERAEAAESSLAKLKSEQPESVNRNEVLEEAAKAADELNDARNSNGYEDEGRGPDEGWREACGEIATRIRALKGGR